MAFDYEYGDEEAWSQASRKKRYVLIGFVVTAVLTLVVGLGAVVYAFTGSPHTNQAAKQPAGDVVVGTSDPALPTDEPSVAPSPTLSPTPSKTPSKPPTPKPRTSKPLAKPKETALPPAPSPKPVQPGCKPSYNGTNAPKDEVKTALDNAAGHTFWGSTPQIKIPAKLMYATAWQESGWQSAIQACDGGIGTMQVMPNTVTWMNQRFGTSWNVNTLSGNVMLGGQYLAWLTKYFGDQLGTYDLLGDDVTLLEAVISAYNVGYGSVNLAAGHAGLVNPTYVGNVRALMTNCPCTSS